VVSAASGKTSPWPNCVGVLEHSNDERKRKRLITVTSPFFANRLVKAINCVNRKVGNRGHGWLDEGEVGEALFGRKEWQWEPGNPETIHQVRNRNGCWRGDWSSDAIRRGARVSAVLFGSNLRYWCIARDLPHLWMPMGCGTSR
jgi:hypothetical protein